MVFTALDSGLRPGGSKGLVYLYTSTANTLGLSKYFVKLIKHV